MSHHFCVAVRRFPAGNVEASKIVVEETKLFKITVSFGNVTSLISLPCYMSHASIPAHIRAARGLPDDLVRISAGIEDVDDLLADLDQAMTKAMAAVGVSSSNGSSAGAGGAASSSGRASGGGDAAAAAAAAAREAELMARIKDLEGQLAASKGPAAAAAASPSHNKPLAWFNGNKS